jgi:hypothetical protein
MLVTGNQLFVLRKQMQLGKVAFGRYLGYRGNDATIKREIHRAEAARDKHIPVRMEDRINAARAAGLPFEGPEPARGSDGSHG